MVTEPLRSVCVLLSVLCAPAAEPVLELPVPFELELELLLPPPGGQGQGHDQRQTQASQFFHLRDYSFLFCLGSFDLCYGAQYKKGM